MKFSVERDFIRPSQRMEEKGFFEEMFGIFGDDVVTFTPDSLVSLEVFISNCTSGEDNKSPDLHLLLAAAYYLGETMIRNIPNARWDLGKVSDPSKITLTVGDDEFKQILRPFSRVLNFMLDQSNGIYSYYKALEAVVNAGPHSDFINSDTDEWKHVGDHTKFRMRKSLRFSTGSKD